MKSYEPEETMTASANSVAEDASTNGNGVEPAIPLVDATEAVAGSDIEISEVSEDDLPEDVSEETYYMQGEVSEFSEDELPDEEVEGDERRLPPTRERIWTAISFWGVILLGAVLRFWGLGDKPLHHDESQHAYFSLQLMHNMENWLACARVPGSCYHYDPVLHGPFQFHAIAFVYKIAEILGVPGDGANNYTARIAAATLGTLIVALPYFLRDRLGTIGAWLACFLLATSPSLVYYSRFTREDIYMACFTLLLVVGVARYLRSRKARWLIVAALAFSLSYATKEATFLTVAIFGSFFGALLVWELGLRWQRPASSEGSSGLDRYLPRTAAPLLLIVYFLFLGIVGKWFFGILNSLSIFITANQQNMQVADQFVFYLKQATVSVIPLFGIVLAVIIFVIWLRELYREPSQGERYGIAKKIDPVKQPLLDTIFTMSWTHWFFALIVGFAVFLVLFTVLFTNIVGGIGDGIWAGLYYWLQQQQVARGGQPWYYYLLLIPLYEQIGLVFGLVGVVRSLVRPTRFRLFLVWWFVGNFFIYSWAGEKMPWLTIHITMPMMLLAAIGLAPVVVTLVNLVKSWWVRRAGVQTEASEQEEQKPLVAPQVPPKVGVFAGSSAIFGAVMALLLLAPTLQNMYQLSYVHAADAPHEMMIYVQTSTDVNTVMAKIETLDKKFYGGKHLIPIGIYDDPAWPGDNPTWPFGWYLRGYPNMCLHFPTGCPTLANNIPVILASGNALQDAFSAYSPNYLYHQYPMRTQWDQGYMMPPCRPTPTQPCTDPQPYVGVGPLLWLSYGDNPPPGASFNVGLAAKNVWQWWWQRKAIGNTNGSYDMGLLIRKGLDVTP